MTSQPDQFESDKNDTLVCHYCKASNGQHDYAFPHPTIVQILDLVHALTLDEQKTLLMQLKISKVMSDD